MATTKDTERTAGGVKYRGETFPGFNKPKRAPSDSQKKMRVLAKKGDEIKVVEFGQKFFDGRGRCGGLVDRPLFSLYFRLF